MKHVKTTSRTFDATGAGNRRMMRMMLLWKALGLSDLARGSTLREIAALGIRHHLGRSIAIVTVKHEQRWMRFLRGFRQRRAVLSRRAGLIRDKLLGRL